MRWTLKPKPDPQSVKQLASVLSVDEVISTLLVQRGISTFEEAKKFFRPSLDDLHDPYLMSDMKEAVERIELAIDSGENILVYGDYDVDGTTSVALVASFLRRYTDKVATYIPDRYSEGYGISYTGIDFAADNDITLIIALDCGIKAIDKVDYARDKGVEFIICDHHRPGEKLPAAVAVLDPKREDCKYPYKELCGCGIGFKLTQALNKKKGRPIDEIIPYLDLVATAIGADIVQMTGENRVLAYFGLKVINSSPRVGFASILKQIKKRELTIADVVFIIAPRINAAGRMKHGNYAVSLLTETDSNLADQYAAEIETFNTDRKSADSQITEEALSQIRELGEENRMTTVVYNPGWHKGVIGIVASRLTETYYRPTVVFTKSGDRLTASARSVKGFDIYNALEQCSAFIEQFGGHTYAAGLTITEENFKGFKAKFEEVVSSTIDEKLLTPEILIDLPIDLSRIDSKFYRIIKQFAPFGPGNKAPVFMSENLIESGNGKCVGADKTHLKIAVAQNGSASFSGIGFGLGKKLDITQTGEPFAAVFAVDENEWQGETSLQLKLKDIRG